MLLLTGSLPPASTQPAFSYHSGSPGQRWHCPQMSLGKADLEMVEHFLTYRFLEYFSAVTGKYLEIQISSM